MKVLLVGINSKYIHPAMGIIQLAANTTWPVTLREFTIKDDPQRIAKEISDFHADVVGISVYIWNATLVKTILSQLSQQLTIVVGGPEASYRPAEYFAFSNVDYLVKDEGEQAFHYLLNYLNGLMPLDEVPNLYYRGEEIKFTFNALPDITTIKHDYSLMGNLKHRYLYLESSRGCPYACSYCLASLEKKVRFFPLSQIKKEILWAFHIKTPTVKFLDRTFNCDSQRMIEILSFIQEHDTKQTVFQFEVVADILNEETVRFLKQLRPGLVRFEIGIQSANETTMEAISRKQNFSQIQTIVQQLKPTITIHLDLIAGLPYEDKPSFINTFNQTLLMFPDELQLGILKALAGTKIVAEKALHAYVFNPLPPYDVLENKYLTRKDLAEIKLVEEGLNRYYNSHRFPKTLDYLLKDCQLNPYQLFLTLGTYLSLHPECRLQIKDLAKAFYKAITTKNQDYFLFLLKQDYLDNAKLKPPLWWDYELTKSQTKAVLDLFKQQYPQLSKQNLMHNSRLITWSNKETNHYYLVLYQPKQSYTLNKKD